MTHTTETMKARCIEATETWRLMRIRVGPSSKSGFWPAIAGEPDKDYAPETTRVVRLPTAGEIARADEFTGWVNTYLGEEERKEVWQWGRLKVLPHRTIRGFCEKIGLREHEYRARISKLFQKLAFTVGGNPAVLCSPPVDDAGDLTENRASSGRSARHWIADDARPQHMPESAEHRRLVRDLLKRQKQRNAA